MLQHGWRSVKRLTRSYSTRDYNAAVAKLNTLQSNHAIVEQIRNSRHEMNLKAIPEMIEWCQRIGYEPSDFDELNPIHIAGTKGKGSTSSFLSSILAQYLPTKLSIDAERLPSDVGLYTSPHLRFVRERIQVNNAPVSEADFAACFFDIWDRLGNEKPVYFRYLTLMAFHHYMQTKVGTAVIECGIGGEYDSTNILVKPSVTGITSLGIDHTAILGDTIESIAWHKAGILKPDVPAFTTLQPPSAMKVLEARAKERQTTLHVAPMYKALQDIKLGPEFQRLNASLAIAIASAHLQRLGYSNLPVDEDAPLPAEFVTGLEKTRLAGRCEKRKDILSEITWRIDGGHTLESIKLAGQWYSEDLADNRTLIFNQQTRDAPALAKALFGMVKPFQHVIFCTNTTYAEGYKADLVSINVNNKDVDTLKVQHELARTWAGLDAEATVHIVATIEEAISLARDLAGGVTCSVLATGSLHLVGGVTEVLEDEIERARL